MYVTMDVLFSKCCSWGHFESKLLAGFEIVLYWLYLGECKRAQFLFTPNKIILYQLLLIHVIKPDPIAFICVSVTIVVLFLKSLHAYFLEESVRKLESSWK